MTSSNRSRLSDVIRAGRAVSVLDQYMQARLPCILRPAYPLRSGKRHSFPRQAEACIFLGRCLWCRLTSGCGCTIQELHASPCSGFGRAVLPEHSLPVLCPYDCCASPSGIPFSPATPYRWIRRYSPSKAYGSSLQTGCSWSALPFDNAGRLCGRSDSFQNLSFAMFAPSLRGAIRHRTGNCPIPDSSLHGFGIGEPLPVPGAAESVCGIGERHALTVPRLSAEHAPCSPPGSGRVQTPDMHSEKLL